MPRPKIVADRIQQILTGRLMRYVDILNEYQRRYHLTNPPFKPIADNLKRMKEKGEIIEIAGYYGLLSDILTGQISKAEIDKALKKAEERRKVVERAEKARRQMEDYKFHMFINTASVKKIKYALQLLEEGIPKLRERASLIIPWAEEEDRERIVNELRLLKRQKEKLEELLREGLFAFEFKKVKSIFLPKFGNFEKFESATMQSISRLSPKQRKKALTRIEDVIASYPLWTQKKHSKEDKMLAERYLQLLERMKARLEAEG